MLLQRFLFLILISRTSFKLVSFYQIGEDDPSLNKGAMEMHFVPMQSHSTTRNKADLSVVF